jgi:hypothetical protein
VLEKKNINKQTNMYGGQITEVRQARNSKSGNCSETAASIELKNILVVLTTFHQHMHEKDLRYIMAQYHL